MCARLLPLLLLAATALFTTGAIAERSTKDEHHDEPGTAHVENAEPGSEAAEHGEGEGTERAETTTRETGPHGDSSERLVGIDVESTPLIVLATLAGIALAIVAASQLRASRMVVAAIALAALAWAALDVRELVHQLDESREGIAAIALAVALLHVGASALAGRDALRRAAGSA